MKVSRVFGWMVLAIGLAGSAVGQGSLCRPSETARACLMRVVNETPQRAVYTQTMALTQFRVDAVQRSRFALARSRAGHGLAASNTGSQSAELGQTSSTKDFTNPFLALLENAGLGKRDGDTLNFIYNLHFKGKVPDEEPRNTLSFSAQLKDPAFSSVATKYFQEHPDLEKPTLGGADDATFKVAFEMLKLRQVENAARLARVRSEGFVLGLAVARSVSDSRGGNAPPYAAKIAAMPAADQSALRDALVNEDPATRDAIAGVGLAVAEMLDSGRADPLLDALSFRASNVRSVDAQGALLTPSDLEAYVDAAASEPFGDAASVQTARDRQLYLEGSYHRRGQLVGGDEVGATVNFEIPFGRRTASAAIADARASINDGTDDGSAAKQRTADDVWNALANTETPEDDGPRLTLSAGYKQSRSWEPRFQDVSIAAVTPSSHAFNASVIGGWKLNTKDVKHSAKLDLNATYENDSNDAKKRDRLIASLTYTQKLTDKLSLPLAVVYTNHQRYLPDTDKRLSALFGLNYKILKTQ
ncbi:MAG: hypothetical protein JOZ54_02610 [Acidobacteria bacterium]|nr:hypothetical protein [Acidobacteriota bacterium]